MAAGELLLGIILALGGGASLALAMVTQRYALAFPAGRIPFLGLSLPRNVVWFIGLVIYGAANGLYAVAQLFGPLSLLAGVFTTLLIWNMVFARLLLGEQLTPSRTIGAAIILLGVIMCVVATPGDIETEFSPSDVEDLSSRAIGAVYISILFVSVVASVGAIVWYEKRYPNNANDAQRDQESRGGLDGATSTSRTASSSTSSIIGSAKREDSAEREKQESGQQTDTEMQRESPTQAQPGFLPTVLPAEQSARAQHDEDGRCRSPGFPCTPPRWLDRIMGLIYPGSLGLDEGIAHLTMKASVSMLDTCSEASQCSSPTLFLFGGVWILASVATLWWLRRVFSRYETTLALPVEYGTVNAVSACSGLLFYREASLMATWQLAVMLAGVAVILIGIAAGRTGESAEVTHSQLKGGRGPVCEHTGAASLAFQVPRSAQGQAPVVTVQR